MAGWNYRVLHRRLGSEATGFEDEYAIYEVFYDDAGEPDSRSVDPQFPHGDTVDELRRDLERYSAALTKPILEWGSF